MSGREDGQVAVGALVVLCVLGLVASGVVVLGRAALAQARAGGAADAAALAAARVLLVRGDDVLPRRDPLTRRTLPPRITIGELETEAARAAGVAARTHGAEVRSVHFAAHGAGSVPVEADVEVGRIDGRLPSWLGAARVRRLTSSRARAGVEPGYAAAPIGDPRPADLAGFDGARAVVAAAEAQLGWPYVWGGESRAEGGFDCSGLVDFALAAAGYPVGRLTASGLQEISQRVPLVPAALAPGDLLFVGRPAHHVGLVAGAGMAIEAPHTGAVVHLEPIAAGGWTGAGRIASLGGAAADGGVPAGVPAGTPMAFRSVLAEAAARENVPAALLAAQLDVESGFTPRAVSSAGARGAAQFMPATWSGDWNPYRGHSPFEPRWAVLAQARYLRLLLDRARGEVPRALAAYNAGWEGSSGPWPPETRAYVAAIMRRFAGPADIARSSVEAPWPGAGIVRLLPDAGWSQPSTSDSGS
jgi:cell wall-associated NlpC family hydrolase